MKEIHRICTHTIRLFLSYPAVINNVMELKRRCVISKQTHGEFWRLGPKIYSLSHTSIGVQMYKKCQEVTILYLYLERERM